ncbi:MAG: hypothetical protein ACO1NU_16420 [Arcticibacter sp.]
MDNYEFGALVEGNFLLYLALIGIVGIVYFLLYRKVIVGILDPYFIYVVSTVFAVADVFLLYFVNGITLYYFTHFLLTQAAFLVGFFMLKVFRNKVITSASENAHKYDDRTIRNILILVQTIVFLLFFIIQVYVYLVNGIPLFYESRLDFYSGGGGFGFMARVLMVLSLFFCYLFLLNTFRYAKTLTFLWRLFFGGMFLFYLSTLILSGGKSSILVPLSVFFAFLYTSGRRSLITNITNRYFWWFVLGLLALVSIIILVQSTEEEAVFPILAIFYRFIVSGDVYWYTYPNDVIRTYNITANGFAWLFNDILGLFRFMSWKDFGEHPGVYFYSYHHFTEVTKGPNMRHNVFGLLFFGYFGGIVYSFILGLLQSFVRFFLSSVRSNNVILNFIIVYLFVQSPAIEPDVTLFLFSVNNLLLILPVLIVFLFLSVAIYNLKWSVKSIFQ